MEELIDILTRIKNNDGLKPEPLHPEFPNCEKRCGMITEFSDPQNNKLKVTGVIPCSCRAEQDYKMDLRKNELISLFYSNGFRNYKPKCEEQLNAFKGWIRYREFNSKKSITISGAVGSGKTDIAIRIGREMARLGLRVKYVRYMQFIKQASAQKFNTKNYENLMKELSSSDVLIIDDLLKCKDRDKSNLSKDEIEITFDLIDRRYSNGRKRIITTSEFDMDDILAIDEAIGSRLADMAKGFCWYIGSTNWRIA